MIPRQRLLLMLILPAPAALHADEPSPFSQLQDITLCIPMLQEQRDTALCAVHAEGSTGSSPMAMRHGAAPRCPVIRPAPIPWRSWLCPHRRNTWPSAKLSKGHPAASVIDFELWRTQGIIKSLWRSAVYPGYIAINHWQGESLALASNHDLTREDQLNLSPESDQLLADREFLPDPGSGRIVQMGNARPNSQ